MKHALLALVMAAGMMSGAVALAEETPATTAPDVHATACRKADHTQHPAGCECCCCKAEHQKQADAEETHAHD